MLTEEQFEKMDLTPIYLNNKLTEEIQQGFYVYLIKNQNNYYIGLSENLSVRLQNHIVSNKNNINRGGELYVLERCWDYRTMRDMEYLWIVWFYINSNCINASVPTYKIRKGLLNKNSIKNTNYKKFIDYGVIKGLPILERQNNIAKSDEEYFGQNLER